MGIPSKDNFRELELSNHRSRVSYSITRHKTNPSPLTSSIEDSLYIIHKTDEYGKRYLYIPTRQEVCCVHATFEELGGMLVDGEAYTFVPRDPDSVVDWIVRDKIIGLPVEQQIECCIIQDRIRQSKLSRTKQLFEMYKPAGEQ